MKLRVADVRVSFLILFLITTLLVVVMNTTEVKAKHDYNASPLRTNSERMWSSVHEIHSRVNNKQSREEILSQGNLQLRSLYLGSFSKQEKRNIEQSIEYLEDRLNDAFNSNLLSCIAESAVRGHDSGMSFFGDYQGTPLEPYIEQIRDASIQQRGLGILALQFTLLFLGEDGFQNKIPRLNIYQFDEDSNTWGRAHVGTVSLGYGDSGMAYWQGAFTVGLNKKYFSREDYDVEAMAGVIFHEMLHNLGHSHPSTGDWDTDYAELLITSAGQCVENSD